MELNNKINRKFKKMSVHYITQLQSVTSQRDMLLGFCRSQLSHFGGEGGRCCSQSKFSLFQFLQFLPDCTAWLGGVMVTALD